MTKYQLIEVDRAGNSYPICESDDFDHICEQAILAKRQKSANIYQIINPDHVDIDCPSGLTEEEQELLP